MFIYFYMMTYFSHVLNLFPFKHGLVWIFSSEEAELLSNFRKEHEQSAIND